MNCQSFENSITDLTRRQPFEPEALTHAETCAECAQKLEEQRSLTLGLRGLAEAMSASTAPANIEEQLLAAFRERKSSARNQPPRSRRWMALTAATAALLLVTGLVALQVKRAHDPTIATSAGELLSATVHAPLVIPAVQSMPVPVSNERRDTGRRSTQALVKHRAKRLPAALPPNTEVARNFIETEVATEFMPVGDVSVANLQEGAQVVRIEMPRYAMARFGLPVNMERYDEKVKADVWVGMDGLARAIRFVQ